ncbi:MAG: precorrin-6A reductase [Bacillota bacterium]
MILVLAGTKDGRLLAKELADADYPVLASAVSPYGCFLLKETMGGEVRSGPLDEDGLVALLWERQITMVVDATHPFAVEVRHNVQRACARLQIPGLRFERESLPAEQGGGGTVLPVADLEGAINAAAPVSGKIFLATGSSSVAAFVRALDPQRLIVRLLPDPESLRQCMSLGIDPGRIVAMQGPFTVEMNREMFRHFGVALVISKESGKTGGLSEKITAAEQLQIPIIVIGRPPLPQGPVFSDIQELLAHVHRYFNKA